MSIEVRNLTLADCVAGASVAGLLVPEAVAYAHIANLPTQAALVALFAGLCCYGLLGTSRFAILSATSSSAAVVAAAVAGFGPGGAARLALASGLVLVTGLYFVLAGWARLGGITHFIARPVLRGFALGIAILISLRQVLSMVGLTAARSDVASVVWTLVSGVAHWNLTGLASGASALAVLALMARARRVPAALLVLALGAAVAHWLGWPGRGVPLVGPIEWQLQRPVFPALPAGDWRRLAELGFAMVMILYSESYGSIRAFALKHGDPIRANRDLLAIGTANIVSAVLQGMPAGAGYSGTAANEAAGAATRRAGLIAGAVVLLIIELLLPFLAQVPDPVLGAVIVYALSHTFDPAVFRPYFRWHRDRLVVLAAVGAVLWLGVLDGLLAGIAFSLAMMLRGLSIPAVSTLGCLGGGHDFVSIALHPEAKSVPGLLIVRLDQPMFFANAERLLGEARKRLLAAGDAVHTLVLSLEETPDLDSTCLEALRDFFQWSATRDTRLVLARLKPQVRALLTMLVGDTQGAPMLTNLSVDDAVHIARAEP
jgi:MFS superfamily sulfate permease-like transporter